MINLAEICCQTTEFLEQHRLLLSPMPSGEYRGGVQSSRPLMPENVRICAHYADLRGLLYADPTEWELYHDVVASFCRNENRACSFALSRLYGRIPVEMKHLIDELPVAFSQLGFQSRTHAGAARRAIFSASGSCRVKDLPEPYGKWLQHCKREARWTNSVELEAQVICTLAGSGPGATELSVEMSTFMQPVIDQLADILTQIFAITPRLQMPLSDLRQRATWCLHGRTIDLTQLQ